MSDMTILDYRRLDHPDITSALFHPRGDSGAYRFPASAKPVLIAVGVGETIGGVFYAAGKTLPTVLFFHGNGEVAADYNEIAPLFTEQGFNFFPVDYRGYGRSSGTPSASTMMSDCRDVFDYVKGWLTDLGFADKIIIMGRSLGSACALELAVSRDDDISGLVIESGFARTLPLLNLLGVDTTRLGLTEAEGFRNIDKVSACRQPLLVIHAENDHIIPLSEGRALFDRGPAVDKAFIMIPGADHNTVFYYGMRAYLSGLNNFIHRITG